MKDENEKKRNELLFDKMLIRSKTEIQSELTKIKNTNGRKLSSYGVALQKVIDTPNNQLAAEYELILDKKSSMSSNMRNAISQLFELATSKFLEEIKKNTKKKEKTAVSE